MKSRVAILIVFSMILSVSIGFGYGTPVQEEGKQEETKQEETKEEAKEEAKQEEKKEEGSETAEAPEVFPEMDNMHHFMEYLVEPTYKSLKSAIAEKPSDIAEWKVIKGYALILGESSALIANRPPRISTPEQVKEWRQISWEVREASRVLYRSMRNYPQARKSYETLIDNCNKCHDAFEDGRHQLEK